MGFESLTDEQLLVQVRRTADACVRVTRMSPEQRHRVEPKRGTSPDQAAVLSAWFTVMALDECERRGL